MDSRRRATRYAPRYSFPPFLLRGRRTERLLSSSAPTPTCAAAADGDVALPSSSWSQFPLSCAPPPPLAAAGSSAQRSYAVLLRSKSPTSPVRDEFISRPRRFLAFTYIIHESSGGQGEPKREGGEGERRPGHVRYWGPGSTRARRHRLLSRRRSQSRQSRPIRRCPRGPRRRARARARERQVGRWLGKHRVWASLGRRRSRPWEIPLCPVGLFPCVFWASFELWMTMRGMLVLSWSFGAVCLERPEHAVAQVVGFSALFPHPSRLIDCALANHRL